MQAKQAQLHELLDGRKRFTIPIYQRTYSWKKNQSEQLFNDILSAGRDDSVNSYFIGSIVYFKPDTTPITGIPRYLVIDGQQRMTTVSLFLLALTRFLRDHGDVVPTDESWEGIQEVYLVNKLRDRNDEPKLSLAKKDDETFAKLVGDVDTGEDDSKPVLASYKFFCDVLNRENIQAAYYGFKKLTIIDVTLEKEDEPQLIFESLNSTGLGLSSADLIRNYILMHKPIDSQKERYDKYWYPMELSFGENLGSLVWFIRDYLTMKEGEIPNIGLVYEAYKGYLQSQNITIEEAISDLYKYSKYYVNIALQKESDPDLAKKIKEASKLKIDRSYPFLLAVYNDYEEKKITKEGFIEIIELISSYVFRRSICDIPTNTLNTTFSRLYINTKPKPEKYLELMKVAFLKLNNNRRFPNDDEFTENIQTKDIYHTKSAKYLLDSLENWNRKEPIDTESYTIEHILPQNQDLSHEWRTELGDNWQDLKDKYLHTLGNLTLTGYNSELSDRPFSDKKEMEGGFNSSPLSLNESVREAGRWTEEAICNRASALAKRACEVWKMPIIENLDAYKEQEENSNLEDTHG